MTKLGLLFTHGVSLQEWKEIGVLKREVKYYEHLSKYSYHSEFFTYGDIKDLKILSSKSKIKINISNISKISKQLKFKILKDIFKIFIIVINSRNCEIIKTNQLKASLPALILKIIFNKPFYLRLGYEPYLNRIISGKKNIFKDNFIYLFSKISYSISDFISVTTKIQKDFIIQKYGICKNKIAIVPNWIDHKTFYKNDVTNIENTILYVGRLEDEKNPLLLLEALIKLKVSATFIGKGSLSQEIRNRIEFHKLQTLIKVVDFVPNQDLPKYYNSHLITAITSRYEGQPKSLLEAMACGACILGTNVQGINNIILNGKNGILCESDLDSISDKIKILINSPKKRNLLGLNARKSIIKYHTLEKVIKKELKILDKLLI